MPVDFQLDGELVCADVVLVDGVAVIKRVKFNIKPKIGLRSATKATKVSALRRLVMHL